MPNRFSDPRRKLLRYWDSATSTFKTKAEVAPTVIRLSPRRMFPIWDPYRLHHCPACEHVYWSVRTTECPHP